MGAVVGHVPFVAVQLHNVQSPVAAIVTPPATLISGVPQLLGHPIDGVGPFWRIMGPCQGAVTAGTHVPVQPLLVVVLVLEEVDVLDVVALDVAPPIPELVVVLELCAPPLPAAPPADEDVRPAVPVLDV
jgi:hypothetical protein